MMLQDYLTHAARFDARRPAYDDGGVEVTYGEAAARIRRAAGALARQGLQPGAHVAVLAENGPFFLEAYFACAVAGLVAAPLNTRLSAGEIAFMLEDGACQAVLHDAQTADLVAAAGGPRPISEALWRSFRAEGEAYAGPDARDPAALAHLCYTGGTTGRPKGVMLSHGNVAASTMNKLVLGKFQRDDVWLHAAPMFHQADSWATFAFTALGARHVFLPRFNAEAAIRLIADARVTSFQLVPTMIVLMLEAAGATPPDLSSLRRILYGSAPMPVATLERAEAVFGPVFQHIYGLTEAAGTVAAAPMPEIPVEVAGERRKSCGQPIIGVDIRIADRQGLALAPGVVGHIQARGANVMTGYWNRPEESQAAFVDGWLDTGDLGRMDEDGFLFIVDRAKDMIITGGENVYSAEVENVLYRHPDILEAAVIGLADERWGEAVTAAVVRRPGRTLAESDVIAHCRAALSGYKTPKRVHFLEALPKSGAGKILKPELRKALVRLDA